MIEHKQEPHVKWIVARFLPDHEDRTADDIAKRLTLEAFYTNSVVVPRLLEQWDADGHPRTGPTRDAFAHAVTGASAQYGLAYMLREASEGGATTLPAQQLADNVRLAYDGMTGEVVDALTAWLEEWGVDVDAVLRAADEPVKAEVSA